MVARTTIAQWPRPTQAVVPKHGASYGMMEERKAVSGLAASPPTCMGDADMLGQAGRRRLVLLLRGAGARGLVGRWVVNDRGQEVSLDGERPHAG